MSRLVKICPNCRDENGRLSPRCQNNNCRQNLENVAPVQREPAVEPPPPSIDNAHAAPLSGPQPTAAIPALGRLEMTESPYLVIEIKGSGNLGRGAETDLGCIPRAEYISRHHAQKVPNGS